ncbi:pyruvate formate-lyase-activating protein [Candidatus Thiodictyon syntrophicum]|jgi:pyruvate formate lyase activating enzyme|uniref:Pyruvate formate-lyase-activating enzyme n=1 Tax=Candidatus Thiodictyon syntrophicum TaxID=1166950 RepID=A0A2K8U7G9_9GAMM|nr:pyruvate formate-lyase-activating protein [Candidatus Thiodictyon syntrophicum]AUB81522.1 pyruvate formate-lyase 1-activating enzyme [Candidatus Thiodictyon syntrophicum]
MAAVPDPSAVDGYVHSVETAGTLDGPGVRFVVFVAGCRLTCSYCHNPDATKLSNGKLTSSAALLAEIAQYKPYLVHTRGGVTISGGEPLVQPAFTEALLKGCKKMGLHTAIDTSGYGGMRAPDSLLDHTNLVLLDIKSGLPALYQRVTGAGLQPTLDFARRLEARRLPVWVRFVLVPGLTDGEDNIRAVAKIVAGLSNVERVEVLPFHKMGEHKWDDMGMTYTLKDTPTPTREQAERATDIFREYGLDQVLRGTTAALPAVLDRVGG